MDTSNLQRRALALAVFTVTYNLIEGGVSLAAAAVYDSHSLWGFGLDSVIESLSGLVMVWRFGWCGSLADGERAEWVEQRAALLVGCSLGVLAIYILGDASVSLTHGNAMEENSIGFIVGGVSLVVMPVLYVSKKRLGVALNSPSLLADAKETLACVLLSGSLFLGAAAHIVFGFWWVDSAASLLIGVLVAVEAIQTVRESFESQDDE